MQKFVSFLILISILSIFLYVRAESGGIDFLSLSSDMIGVQDGEMTRGAGGEIIVRGVSPLLISRAPVDASRYHDFSFEITSADDLTGFLLWGKAKEVKMSPFLVYGGGSPKEYAIDLWTYPDFEGNFSLFGMGFQHPLGRESEIVVSRMMLASEESSGFIAGIGRFFTPELIRFSSMNVLFGPKLWGKPFTVWLFLAGLAGVLLFLFFAKDFTSARARTALLMATVLAWMTYDARNLWDLYSIAHKDKETLVASDRYDQTYDGLEDLYGFLNFVQDRVPSDAPISFMSAFGGVYELRAEYFLRPRPVGRSVPEEGFLALYRYPVEIDEENQTVTIEGKRRRYKRVVPFEGNSRLFEL